jgi:hypothetical protein
VPGAGNPQALNRYSYVLNNPLRYTDPTGNCWEGIDGPGGCGSGAGGSAIDQAFNIVGIEESPDVYRTVATCGLGCWSDRLDAFKARTAKAAAVLFLADYDLNAQEWTFSQRYAVHDWLIDSGNYDSVPFHIGRPYVSDAGVLMAYIAVAQMSPGGGGGGFRLTGSGGGLSAKDSAAIISRTAQAEANSGVNYLKGFLSKGEVAAYDANPAGGSRFLGQAVHRATARALETNYGKRFSYSTRGPDFTDAVTGQRIELTTPGQASSHAATYGVPVVTYTLP